MITKLTPEQESLIPVIAEKWTTIGLLTEQLSINEITLIVKNFDNKVLSPGNNRPAIVFNSPIEAWAFISLNNLNQVENQVENQVRNQVRNQVWNQVRNQVWNQVGNQVWNQSKNLNLIDFIWPYCLGSFDCGYFSWVDFYQQIGLKNFPSTEIIESYLETSKVGLIYPLDNFIVVTQKPNFISKNSNGLHCETGPALSYNDNGLSDIYSLNGVIMTKDQVMTPAEKLDPQDILKEQNVEVRRELLRKIGIERFLQVSPHKVLDKRDNYELLSLKLSDEIPNARYLKMINPSIGCYHVEGVAPECNTVQHAINWRKYQTINPDVNWEPAIVT